ncbi:hypothetical protein H5410_054614 [Solanum commersonii]|uniref:Uncharacterized protein n=1 Tax=Solanum commersonii TaxID=4109 RepID=A0A9J5WHN0_SOLCO|nr:hypothetical protein H5410_054614 [Solanum commersonii]
MATFDNDLKLQSICECLKKEALAIGVIEERAKQIPQLCNICLSIPSDPINSRSLLILQIIVMSLSKTELVYCKALSKHEPSS